MIRSIGWRATLVASALLIAPFGSAFARTELEVSLKSVVVPAPTTIGDYIADHAAAVRLGKALFWDVRIGSDGQTACATCHHQAGADSRVRNTFHPGPNGGFTAGIAPGTRPDAAIFPLTRFQDPADRFSTRQRSIDDIAGSGGVMREVFLGLDGTGGEQCQHVSEPVFIDPNGNAQRQVTGRNAPSVVNAIFNVRQFWDGRANAWFNGVNPFGPVDPTAKVWHRDPKTGALAQTAIALDHASLASQAVGPVNNDVEMAAHGRNWADVARKLLDTNALASQTVSAGDSVLGGYSRLGSGLTVTYRDMIDAAFKPEWRGDAAVAPGLTQSQANMALFFGLAVQLYEATLVSDDTRYDQWIDSNGPMGGAPGVLNEQELRGLRLFFNADPRLPRTNCQLCHMSSLFTGATYEGEGGGGGDVPGIGMFPGDSDSDHDGIPDIVDEFPKNPADWRDSDGDGMGDGIDDDDDGDGLLDSDDPAPLDPFNAPPADPGDGVHAPSPILEEHSLASTLGSSAIFREPPVGFEPSVLPLDFTIKGKGIDLVDAKGAVLAHVPTQARKTYPSTFEESAVVALPQFGEFAAFVVDMKILAGKMTIEIAIDDLPVGQVFGVKIDGVMRASLSASDPVLFESGFDNIGVRPWDEDLGLGGAHPNGVPLSPSRRLQSNGNLVEYGDLGASQGISPRVDGAFKVPTLRNIELTGPYFHNGGTATLEDVIRFYNRGGDFHEYNATNLAPDIRAMQLGEQDIADLAAFLRALTDERVRDERAPFDHPSLPLADGRPLPAVGGDGRQAGCALALKTFAENLADPNPGAGDCDGNGLLDSCEITRDPRLDHDHNGVLDACEHRCPADLNLDRSVNGMDLTILLGAFGRTGADAGSADIDGSGQVDGADLSILLGAWGTGCP